MSPSLTREPRPHAIDEATAVATLQAAIRHASITGAEAHFAGYLAELLRSIGMDEVTVSEFLPGRPNVVGDQARQRRRQAAPAHRPHRRRACPRLARALGRRSA